LTEQRCPLCSTNVPVDPRYPNHLCEACVARAVDESGRALQFSNRDLSGGFVAAYADTGEKRDSHVCYVDGTKCWADEARFGGVVVQPYGKHDEFPVL